MRTRSNFGVNGSLVTVGVASSNFIGGLADHRVKTLEGQWPTIFSTNLNYQSLIDASTATKLYVSKGGNDSNSGSTISTALLTINGAVTKRATSPLSTQNVMIIVYPGSYSANATSLGSSSALFTDPNSSYSTVVVCSPGQVIINYTAGTDRDAPVCAFYNANSALYGATILRNNNAKADSYMTAFFNNTTSAFKGKMYNTVLRETNANNKWSLQYDNGQVGGGQVNYCSFYTLATGLSDYSGGPNFYFNNCAFNYAYGSSAATFTNAQILASNNMDPNTYVSPGVTTAGVYYGTYAWPAA